MSEYRQKAIKVEAIRLENRTLIQTSEGAMSAEAGDYLETIKIGEKTYQRIVPAWVFEGSHERLKRKGKSREAAQVEEVAERIVTRIEAAMISEPHDGYPLLQGSRE